MTRLLLTYCFATFVIALFGLNSSSAQVVNSVKGKSKANTSKLSTGMSFDQSFQVMESSVTTSNFLGYATYKLNMKHSFTGLQYVVLPNEVEKGESKAQLIDTFFFHNYSINDKFTYCSVFRLPISDTTRENGRLTSYEGRILYRMSLGPDNKLSVTLSPLATYFFNEYKFSPITQRKNRQYGIGGIISLYYSVSDKVGLSAFYLQRLDWEERSDKDTTETNQTNGSYLIDTSVSYNLNPASSLSLGHRKSEVQRSGGGIEYVLYRPETSEYYLGLNLSI